MKGLAVIFSRNRNPDFWRYHAIREIRAKIVFLLCFSALGGLDASRNRVPAFLRFIK